MIRIENLIKKFGKYTAVDIDALEIASGCVAGLVGNNGAGKTTLLRLILDLYKADAGRVLVSGNNVAVNEEWKKTSLPLRNISISSGIVTGFPKTKWTGVWKGSPGL